jgi:hypothetical protein
MARSGGPQDLGQGVEAMIPVLPRANLEDGSARALRSLLHREMTGKISARSAQLAMERLVPKLEPARIVPPINLDTIPTPTNPALYRTAVRGIFRAAMDGKCSLDDARKAMILTKTLYGVECEVAAAEALDKHRARA